MLGPLALYRAEVDSGALADDPAQAHIVSHLQTLFEAVSHSGKKRWWSIKRPSSPQGIYLVGPVGRGKTHLMDLLADALLSHGIPTWRIHFHGFMLEIQERLNALVGQRDPLVTVAEEVAQKYRVLCFDECHVEDIGDAMILGELLHGLFERGVVLVTTSNQAPDELYSDGLQRARFLPAIDAIKAHCQVLPLDANEDYRLRTLTQAPTYFHPINNAHIALMTERFLALSGHSPNVGSLCIEGRMIKTLGQAGTVVWFDFEDLCRTERSVRDYRAIFDQFNTVLISHIPSLGPDDDNATKRLIHLVDEAYDRAIKLVLLADTSPEAIYHGRRLEAAFRRTISRLIEMQSADYLAKISR